MRRYQYIGLIILLLIGSYMGFGLRRYLSVNDGYKIVQVEDLEAPEIYEYLYMKYPMVILRTFDSGDLIGDFSIEKVQSTFGNYDGYFIFQDEHHICSSRTPRFDKINRISELDETQRWKCLLNHTFIKKYELYKPIHSIISNCCPKLSLNNRYSITISSSGYIEPLQYSHSYKTMITSLKGTKVVRLFNPKYKNSLHMDNKFHPNYRMSRINIWKEWDDLCERYNSLRDTQYIDLILREGNTLLIPNFWFFSTRNDDLNITLYSKVDTALTHILQLPYATEKCLHYMGLYKVNECYCHRNIKV